MMEKVMEKVTKVMEKVTKSHRRRCRWCPPTERTGRSGAGLR